MAKDIHAETAEYHAIAAESNLQYASEAEKARWERYYIGIAQTHAALAQVHATLHLASAGDDVLILAGVSS